MERLPNAVFVVDPKKEKIAVHEANKLGIPVIVALLLVLLTGWLVWVTQIKLPQERANAERLATVESQLAEMAEDGEGTAEAAASEVDIDTAIAAAEKGGCAACHTIPGIPNAQGQVGPDLSNIGADAATRIDGYNAEEYIHESIADPLGLDLSEQRIMESLLWSFVEQLRSTRMLAELGLLEDEEWRLRVRSDTAYYLANDYGRAWWANYSNGNVSLPQDLKSAINARLEGVEANFTANYSSSVIDQVRQSGESGN